MKCVPLYKGITLTIQEKCTKCTSGVQDYPLYKILIDYKPLVLFSLLQKMHSMTFIFLTLVKNVKELY